MRVKTILIKTISPFLGWLFPTKWKEINEFSYWKNRKKEEGELANSHYEYYYTSHFGIEKSFYNNKVLLDIGCGPRGSLEWAKNARRRIGLDPLADKYLKLGASKHTMEYLSSGAETIPLEDDQCDVIFSFNSLDHVKDIDNTVKEIKRCLAPNGNFLLLVEVNHPPTVCEPHNLSPKRILDLFGPEFKALDVQVFRTEVLGIYQSIDKGRLFDNPLNCKEIGYLSVRFINEPF